jgi:hypothetical protein
MSPRCPRFQSVIPTRTGTGLTGPFEDEAGCGGPGDWLAAVVCASAGTASAPVACFTKSRRVIMSISLLIGGV